MSAKVVSLADFRAQKKGSGENTTGWVNMDGTPLSQEQWKSNQSQLISCDTPDDFAWLKAATYDQAVSASADSMEQLGAEFCSVYAQATGNDQFIFTGNVPVKDSEHEKDRFPVHPFWDHLV